MNKLQISALFALVFCILLSDRSAAYASEPLSAGVASYNHGEFAQAIRQLKLAEAKDPRNPSVQYYLANALVKLGQHTPAVKHYDRCYRLSPWSDIGYYSLQALIAYRRYNPEVYRRLSDSQAAAYESTHETLSRLRNTTAGILQSAQTGQYDPNLSQTKDLITKQAGFEKHRSDNEAKRGVDSVLAHGVLSAAAIKQLAEDHAEYVESHPPISGYTRTGQPIYDHGAAAAEAKRIRQEGQSKAELAQQHAKQRAERLTAWASNRSNVLDEVVSNLHGQLEAPAGPSGVKLNPVGTDLYVRFYGNGNAEKYCEQSGMPASLSIIPPGRGQHARIQSLEPTAATASRKDSPDAWTSVHGKIVSPLKRKQD